MKNKDNILFYTPGLYPCKTGGMEIYNYHLLRNLRKYYPEFEFKALTGCKTLIDQYDNFYPLKNRLFIIRRRGLGALSTIIYYLFSSKLKWKKTETIFIPHTDNFNYNVIAFLFLKFIFNLNYIIHLHDGGQKPWKPYWLQKMFFKNAKKIAGVSWPIVHEYSKRSECKVEYIPPLLPFKKSIKSKKELKARMGLEHFNKIILFVGSLKQLKKPEILLKAFFELDSQIISEEKLGLVFVGDGHLKSELKALVKEKQFNSHIHFAGKIPNENVADYYALADIFVIPSSWEGTPIVLLEAMFNGLICMKIKKTAYFFKRMIIKN